MQNLYLEILFTCSLNFIKGDWGNGTGKASGCPSIPELQIAAETNSLVLLSSHLSLPRRNVSG